MQDYDRTSKWLIQHHGDAILRLAGVADLDSWRPLQAELVQPRQLPDGLVEARRAGQADPELFVLEIATYPDPRLLEQVLRDMTLVYLDRRTLPEVLVLVLHPKGRQKASGTQELRSPLGWTQWHASWRVVELWTLAAEELLAAGDVGVVPWVPLTHFAGPPGPVLRRCRERIDREAPPEERANLLAVTQVLTRLRYNDRRLLTILGGELAMIESPLLQEFEAKATLRATLKARREDILEVLEARFGPVPPDLPHALQAIEEERNLGPLVKEAACCRDLDSFRARLIS